MIYIMLFVYIIAANFPTTESLTKRFDGARQRLQAVLLYRVLLNLVFFGHIIISLIEGPDLIYFEYVIRHADDSILAIIDVNIFTVGFFILLSLQIYAQMAPIKDHERDPE